MRWSTVILLKADGGLGIIDPEMQSKALLAKLVVRGLFPSTEPWKAFLRHALVQCLPRQSHHWQQWHPSYRCIFSDAPLTQPQSPFMARLMLVWRSVAIGLSCRSPQLLEEFERQPLIWNP